MITVFIAAFLAGGTAAVGVNRFIDVARTQSQPTVECEPIFVARREVPAGSPITIFDVKLGDWPKATMPQSALRPDSFDGMVWPEGHVARLTLREGQPVLRSHLQAPLVATEPAPPAMASVAPIAETVAASPQMTPPPAMPEQPTLAADLAADDAGRAEAPTDASTEVADSLTAAPTADVTVNATAEATAEATVDATQPAVPAAPPEQVATAPTLAEPAPSSHDPSGDDPPGDAVAGEGWPSAAEAAAGSDAAMRFLVVPERIAIMADELTSPPKKPSQPTPSASVASQPRQQPQAVQAESQARQVQPRPVPSGRSPAAMQPSTTRPATSRPAQTRSQPQQQPRSMPTSPAIRQRPGQGSPTTDTKAAMPRTASVATPPVRVEPDPESELADEAARTPILKSVFPNMAAGIEKFESEMSRIRRERLGGLFQSTESTEAAGNGGSPVPSPARTR